MLKTYGIVSGLAPKGAVTMKSALLSAAANKGLQVEVVMDDRIPPVDAPDARTALADQKITVMDAVSALDEEGVAAALVAGNPSSDVAEALLLYIDYVVDRAK